LLLAARAAELHQRFFAYGETALIPFPALTANKRVSLPFFWLRQKPAARATALAGHFSVLLKTAPCSKASANHKQSGYCCRMQGHNRT
jgi:hypothetical protein